MAGISMRELAEALGVSVASVSVALRGKPGISAETRARILEEAQKRGYDRSRLNGSRNTTDRSTTIDSFATTGNFTTANGRESENKGLIEIIDYTYYNHSAAPEDIPYYRQFLEAVTTTASHHGYTLSGPFNPAESGFSVRPPADGSILLGAGIRPEELKEYQQRGLPFVVAGNSLSELPINTVSHDNFYGIQAGISHLASLGHSKIGYIRSMNGTAGTERFRAYRYAIQEKGLEYGECVDIVWGQAAEEPASALTSSDRNTRIKTGAKTGAEIGSAIGSETTSEVSEPKKAGIDHSHFTEYLLSRLSGWLEQTPPAATAFLCDNDLTAASLMRALRSHGYIPGRDISVIGFDDQPFAALLEPPLTSIHTYEPELGETVAEQLIFCLEHPGCRYRHVKLGTELVVRESTAEPLSEPAPQNYSPQNQSLKN